MTRLPIPGSDDGTWGNILNDFLAQEHNADGTLKLRSDGTLDADLKKANNLSDVASVTSARTNLGLGGAATLNVGAAAGTVAAGNDSRITGAEQTANKGVANGYASLGSNTKVPSTQLPLGAVTTISAPAASQTLTVDPGGGAFVVTLTQNVTFAVSGAAAGTECSIDLQLTQDSTGGRTVTWWSGITWVQGGHQVWVV
jgi:hypothetical protein